MIQFKYHLKVKEKAAAVAASSVGPMRARAELDFTKMLRNFNDANPSVCRSTALNVT